MNALRVLAASVLFMAGCCSAPVEKEPQIEVFWDDLFATGPWPSWPSVEELQERIQSRLKAGARLLIALRLEGRETRAWVLVELPEGDSVGQFEGSRVRLGKRREVKAEIGCPRVSRINEAVDDLFEVRAEGRRTMRDTPLSTYELLVATTKRGLHVMGDWDHDGVCAERGSVELRTLFDLLMRTPGFR